MYRSIASCILALIGLLLFIGGVQLAMLGGSLFYICMGLALLLSALLFLMRSRAGLAVYGLALFAALVWSWSEAGFDWWQLSARGSLFVLIGILLLLPVMVRSLHPRDAPPATYSSASGILAASLVIAGGVGGYAMFQAPHDLNGEFPEAQMSAQTQVATAVPAGEWQAYGRTAAGQRYSPLSQITPANIGTLKMAWTYHTGDVRGPNDPIETTYEDTPLMIDGTVYVCTPHSIVIAIDAVSGKEKWRFDPRLKPTDTETTQHLTCRGVSYFDGGSAATPQPATNSATVVPNAADIQKTELARVTASVAEVTTQAAGVPQNVVTGQAKKVIPTLSLIASPLLL